ncbi:MAG TPA: serine/threonine-protein kinase [Polyangiaceae bacterium]|nr:serine/threonine-protein kinase [Polyangiaceae bacterium]
MRPGLLVANRFQVRAPIDRGGMGSVWLAHHVELDMPCALKFIEGAGAFDPALRHRFAQEARAAALLRSPHVVQIFDAGTWEGTPYLAMELLEGETLAKRLRRLGRLRPAACVAVAEQVGRALVRAHAAGVVHRDLKPDNIFIVREEGQELIKVLDFGIAKWARPGTDNGEGVTRYGAMLGTPVYMSPEQARDCRVVDYRSDLWSLAVIVFECMTGRLPFESKRLAELFLQILKDPLPVPSQVAPGLPLAFDAWWAKAANRDPEQRFTGAREMVDALAMALGVSFDGNGPALFADATTDATTSLPSMTTPAQGAGSRSRSGSVTGRRTGEPTASDGRASRSPPASRQARHILLLSLVLGTLGGLGTALLATMNAPPARVGASAPPRFVGAVPSPAAPSLPPPAPSAAPVAPLPAPSQGPAAGRLAPAVDHAMSAAPAPSFVLPDSLPPAPLKAKPQPPRPAAPPPPASLP